jgi:hypothetical protein
LLSRGVFQHNKHRALSNALLELILAVVASRSSLVGALLRTAAPAHRLFVVDFLRGLSRDELECLAEFQGACVLEAQDLCSFNPYNLLGDFFDPYISERWSNADDRAHKTFVVLAWIEFLTRSRHVAVSVSGSKAAAVHAA